MKKIVTFVLRSGKKKAYLYGFAHRQSPQAFFDLMQHVIVRIMQQW